MFATNTFQHDKPLAADDVDCHALFLTNLFRSYHPAQFPLSPLVQTLHTEFFGGWSNTKHLREWAIEWKVGRKNKMVGFHYLHCLQQTGNAFANQIYRYPWLIFLTPHLSFSIMYQAQRQNLFLFHQIASLISTLSIYSFGLLCFKCVNIEQGTKGTWIVEIKAWYINHCLTS